MTGLLVWLGVAVLGGGWSVKHHYVDGKPAPIQGIPLTHAEFDRIGEQHWGD